MTAHDTEAIVLSALEAWNRHDVETVADHFSENGELVDNTVPSVVHTGRAEITAVLREVLENMPDAKFELVDFVAGESRFAGELLWRGTPKGRTEAIEIPYVAFVGVRDGKLLFEHLYYDSAQYPVAG